MKTKIQIKSIFGKLLFEYESENNTIKKTVIKAYLQDAYLQGAYLQGLKIKKACVFTGIYKYIAMPIITNKGGFYIKLGCYTRKLKDWEKDFWNNESEFPNNGCFDSELRILAFETCKKWIQLNK